MLQPRCSAALAFTLIRQSTSFNPVNPVYNAARLQRCITTSARINSDGGSFKIEGKLHTFHERKILPYSQRQLYAIVADTDAYCRFIPFVEASRVISHDGPDGSSDVAGKPWLSDQGQAGDIHKMDHIMKIGVMGFDEEWKSIVECEKWSRVTASAAPSNLFNVLRTTWTLTPSPSNAPHPSHALPKKASSLTNPGESSSEEPGQPTASEMQKDDPTLVSIDLAYEFANPFYAAAAGAAFQKVSGKIMGAFEKRVREVYGNGQR